MDAIRDAINNVSLYEVKAAVRKAQNGLAPVSRSHGLRELVLTSRSRDELHRDGSEGIASVSFSSFSSH
jgi:hypothetical protein